MVGTGAAIIDMRGGVFVSAGWQKACTACHCVHPEFEVLWRDSDILLANSMKTAAATAFTSAGMVFSTPPPNWWSMAAAPSSFRQVGIDSEARAVRTDVSLAGLRTLVAEDIQRTGIDGLLIKPVNASTLLDMTAQVMGHSVAMPRMHATAEDPAKRHPRLRVARVLLAEDNEINQQIACELLEEVGMTVTVRCRRRRGARTHVNGL